MEPVQATPISHRQCKQAQVCFVFFSSLLFQVFASQSSPLNLRRGYACRSLWMSSSSMSPSLSLILRTRSTPSPALTPHRRRYRQEPEASLLIHSSFRSLAAPVAQRARRYMASNDDTTCLPGCPRLNPAVRHRKEPHEVQQCRMHPSAHAPA